MRPGPISPGDDPCLVEIEVTPYASMRPGPISPGDSTVTLRVSRPAGASMRPGPISPGDVMPGSAPKLTRYELQ